MVGGHEFGTLVWVKTPSEGGDPLLGSQKGLGGEGPEGTNDFWFDNLQLLKEKGEAGLDLIRSGIAIVRRTAFYDVGDVYLLSRQVYGLDDTGEEFSCPADERLAL